MLFSGRAQCQDKNLFRYFIIIKPGRVRQHFQRLSHGLLQNTLRMKKSWRMWGFNPRSDDARHLMKQTLIL